MSSPIFAATLLCLLVTAVCLSHHHSVAPAAGAKRDLSSLHGPEHCEFDFKVYVYPLHTTAPALPSVRLAEEARHNGTYHVCVGCIYEQFSLEYIMQDFFLQFCGRTLDPREADFFYLPLVRDVEFRIQKMTNNNKKPTLTELAMLQAMEKNDTKLWRRLFNVTDHWWPRRHARACHQSAPRVVPTRLFPLYAPPAPTHLPQHRVLQVFRRGVPHVRAVQKHRYAIPLPGPGHY